MQCVYPMLPPLKYINTEWCDSIAHRAAKEERCTEHAGAGARNRVNVRAGSARRTARAACREISRVKTNVVEERGVRQAKRSALHSMRGGGLRCLYARSFRRAARHVVSTGQGGYGEGACRKRAARIGKPYACDGPSAAARCPNSACAEGKSCGERPTKARL